MLKELAALVRQVLALTRDTGENREQIWRFPR
jgi:hypothetical protein